jgi:hypothetical protein
MERPLLSKSSKGDVPVKVTCHDAFAQQFEASHLHFNNAAAVVGAPFLDRPVQPARRVQDDVAGICTAAIRLPEFGALAERDHRIHGAQSDRLMAVLRVASAIALTLAMRLSAGI